MSKLDFAHSTKYKEDKIKAKDIRKKASERYNEAKKRNWRATVTSGSIGRRLRSAGGEVHVQEKAKAERELRHQE